jgi:hypothetical protein
MKQYTRFLIAWGVNTLVILLANAYFPTNYVLGNAMIGKVTAGFLVGFMLTFMMRLAKGIIKKNIDARYLRFGFYFIANSVSIWLLARFAPIFGFGIPAFYYAFYLGLAACIFQWISRQIFKKLNLIKVATK